MPFNKGKIIEKVYEREEKVQGKLQKLRLEFRIIRTSNNIAVLLRKAKIRSRVPQAIKTIRRKYIQGFLVPNYYYCYEDRFQSDRHRDFWIAKK